MNEQTMEDIISALYDMVQDARTVPLAADKCIVERDKVLDMLDEIIAQMPLPIGGLMTDEPAEKISRKNAEVRSAVYDLGVSEGIEPFMNMAFVSLPVIPSLKMTTKGLVDVNSWTRVSLYL